MRKHNNNRHRLWFWHYRHIRRWSRWWSDISRYIPYSTQSSKAELPYTFSREKSTIHRLWLAIQSSRYQPQHALRHQSPVYPWRRLAKHECRYGAWTKTCSLWLREKWIRDVREIISGNEFSRTTKPSFYKTIVWILIRSATDRRRSHQKIPPLGVFIFRRLCWNREIWGDQILSCCSQWFRT